MTDTTTETTTDTMTETETETETSGSESSGGATPPPIKKKNGGMPPPLPTLKIFVALNDQPAGPFGQAQLKQMIASGQLTGQTLVWKDGMADWAPANDVAELQAMMQSAAPMPTPEPKPADDPAKYVTGVWSIQNAKIPVGAQQATLSGTVTYKSDGSYSATAQMNLMGGAGQMPDKLDVTAKGTWSATMQGTSSIKISTVDDITIKSNTTGQSQQMQSSDSEVYSIIDQNTMRDELGNTITRMQ